MGEYGLGYSEARRVPWQELLALWAASQRRLARKELRLLEDLYAVAGLQSEVKVEGERPKKGKRVIAVSLNRRREELNAEGYPVIRRSTYDPSKERGKLAAFWAAGGAEGAIVVDRATSPAAE